MFESTTSAAGVTQVLSLNDLFNYLYKGGLLMSVIMAIYYFGKLRQQLVHTVADIKDLKDDIKGLKKKTSNIIVNITSIKTFLVDKRGMDAGLFTAMSPLNLTPKGQTLLSQSGFDDLYISKPEWFLQEARNRSPGTIAELDDIALEIVTTLFESNELPSFKEIAYKNGVSVDVLVRVCAIYLREQLSPRLFPTSSV